jgi:MFS family permease
MGFYQSIYSIGIVAGPIAAGYVARQADLRAVFIMSSILLFIGGMISVAESAAYQKSRKYKREHQVST